MKQSSKQSQRATQSAQKTSKREKIEYGANFIPTKHIQRGTNVSNGFNNNTFNRQTIGMTTSKSGSSKNKQFLKIVVIGDSGVGKSSIIESYQYKKSCMNQKPTIGADFIKKKVKINTGEIIPLQIWDTAGQERFQSLSNTFYRGADCCIIVFDLTSRESYEGIECWRNNFLESVQMNQNDESDLMAPIIIVGNKYDLCKDGKNCNSQRQIDQQQVISDWIDTGEAMSYIECSASSMKNIDKLFIEIADQANDYQQHITEQRETINDLQDQFASIHDIQSQLLLPNKRYTQAAAQRYSNMRNTMGNANPRKSRTSVDYEFHDQYMGHDDYYSTQDRSEMRSERSSYYQNPRHTYHNMESEPNDIESDYNHKIRLTAIKEGKQELMNSGVGCCGGY